MPHSLRNRRRSRAGLNAVQWLVRDSADRLGGLVACWRDHLQLVRELVELENSYSLPQNIRELTYGCLDPGQITYSTCPITRQQFNASSEISLLPCGHYFDREACQEWLRNHDSCPLCRHASQPERDGQVTVTIIPVPLRQRPSETGSDNAE